MNPPSTSTPPFELSLQSRLKKPNKVINNAMNAMNNGQEKYMNNTYMNNTNINNTTNRTHSCANVSQPDHNASKNQANKFTYQQKQIQKYIQILNRNQNSRHRDNSNNFNSTINSGIKQKEKNIYRQSLNNGSSSPRRQSIDRKELQQQLAQVYDQNRNQSTSKDHQNSQRSCNNSSFNLQKIQQKIQKLLESKSRQSKQKKLQQPQKNIYETQKQLTQQNKQLSIKSELIKTNKKQYQEVSSIMKKNNKDLGVAVHQMVNLGLSAPPELRKRATTDNYLSDQLNKGSSNNNDGSLGAELHNNSNLNIKNNSNLKIDNDSKQLNIMSNINNRTISQINIASINSQCNRNSLLQYQQQQPVYTFMPEPIDMPFVIPKQISKQTQPHHSVRRQNQALELKADIYQHPRPLTTQQKLKQNIQANPFAYISEKTTRNSLFNIVYALEEYNQQLKNKFQLHKNYLISQQNIQNKYNINSATQMQRQTIYEFVKSSNAQVKAQSKLLALYNKQKALLLEKISQKKKGIQMLSQQKERKHMIISQLQQKINQSNKIVVQCTKQRTKILDQIKKKKTVQKSTDNGAIQKLLNEYYDTIKQVLSEDSVQRINANTRNALEQVQKRKGLGYLNFVMEEMKLEGKNLKNSSNQDKMANSRNQGILNSTENMGRILNSPSLTKS